MKLSIGILVSNRKAYIRNCMESIKPILEQISSELIAVDTVGTENSDGSIDIVREYTDKIYRFEWCNDFSAARNVLLDHANGEWFDNVDELIRFFDTNEYKNYRSATYVTHDYLKKDGEEYTCSRVSRMAKRTDTLRFVGIIHEVLNEMYFPSKELDIFTHHYGYAYTNNEERKKHSERNLGLLMTAIEEHPRDLRLRSQLALEYINIDSNEAFSYICDVL